MRKIIGLLALFCGMNGYSQLFVDNSYMYVGNQFVYVRQGTNLGATGKVLLRKESQFLQGTTGTSTNSGQGKLSVFQEGTSNNFGYNYWCSPVGVANGGSGNSDFALNPVINRPTGVEDSVFPGYTTGHNGSSTNASLTISTYWIYKFAPVFNNATVYADWVHAGQTGTIPSGLGFTMKGVSGDDDTDVGEATVNNPGSNQRYDFRGRPNDGNIDIPVADDKQTLTGNPYPSAINLNLFLLENSGYTVNYSTGAITPGLPTPFAPASGSITGEAQFWEHIKPANTHVLVGYIGGYGTYVPNNPNAFSPGTYNNASWNTYNIDGTINVDGGGTGTERYKRMFAPVGQGFFVNGKTASTGTATMKNIYRVFRKENTTDSQFEKSSGLTNSDNWDDIPNVAGVDYTQFSKAQVPQIKIHTIINNQVTKEVTMAFNPNTTDGYDVAMEAASEENLSNDVYFSLTGSEKPFVITTLPFGIDKRIPFTFKSASASTYKLTVGNTINFDDSDEVYLYDGETGIYHDIMNGFFEITLPSGVYADRFEITFRNNALNTNENGRNNLMIYQNNAVQNLIVSNPNLLDVKSISLFDITGKKILGEEKLNVETEYKLSTSGLADAVYIVDVNTNKGKVSQKIIVRN